MVRPLPLLIVAANAGGERGRRGRADDVGMAEHDKA
jgi:hypothetical protein